MRLKLLFVTLALLVVSFGMYGQVTIFSENMYNGSGGTSGDAISTHETNNRFNEDGLTYSGTGDIRNTSGSSGYTGSSGIWNAYLNAANETFIIDGINASIYTNLTLSFGVRKNTNTETGTNLIVEYSTTGITGSYTAFTYTSDLPFGNGTVGWYLRTTNNVIPSGITTIRFRIPAVNDFRIDDITLTGAVVSTDAVDYANVQFPGTGTINVGEVFNVYAQAYEPSVTEAAGSGTGILSWIGYSSNNTDPSSTGWTWVPASFNTQSGNNDEFVANIGSSLPAGNYFYSSRFQLNGGSFKYGGFSSGFWNGSTNVNGTLTVNPHLVDWANLQSPSTSTIVQGSTFTAYGQVFEPGVTNISASQGTGIIVDFGISPIGSNTNPNTWTNWTSATYNNSCLSCGDLDSNSIPDNDEYFATTGSALTAGTYYYTFRYSLNGGPYMYGGYNAGGGGFWSGTDISGILTVGSPPTCITEGFNAGTTVPSGWVFTNIGGTYTTSTNYGASSPSLKFDATGDKVETATITNAQELRFWIKGQGTNSVSALLVEGYNGLTWVTIDNITNSIPTTGTTKIYNSGTTPALPTNIEKFRFTYIGAVGNLAFDDVVVTCGPPLVPEMNIKGNGVSIVDGDSSPSISDSTDFGSTIVGNTIVKTFTIENTGVDPLTLTGVSPYVVIAGANPSDFSVSVVPVSPVASSTGTTTFEITFQPSAAGSRTATLSITNNDNDENPYNFSIRGDGIICTPTINIASITPASGPEGTQVTINGTGFTTASEVKFGAITAAFEIVSNTIIKAIVPSGATTGNITIIDTGGCKLSYSSFTVISSDKTTCASSTTAVTELFISEVTDASTGSLTYVEVYNGTTNSIDMTGYKIRFVNNATATVDIPLTTILAPGDSFTLATSLGSTQCSVAGGDGTLADQNNTHSGINNNDCVHLLKGTSIIDTWGITDGSTWITALGLGTVGYDFQRKSSATLPSTTFNPADWTIVDFEECSDNYAKIDSYEGIRIPPTVVASDPVLTLSCSNNSAILTVTATEGVVGGAGLVYQWYEVAPNTTNWTALANGGIYSGTTTATLALSNIIELNGYQYYCDVRENTATCSVASNSRIMDITGVLTVWNGTTWSNGLPTIDKLVIIDANYSTSSLGLDSFEACSVIVNANYKLEISAEKYVKIQNNLTVNDGGNVLVLDKGSLIMVSDLGTVTNNGTGVENIHRFTTPFEKYDYTYWSTPITSTTIATTFPTWRTDYAFEFLPANFNDVAPLDGFDDNGDDWAYASTMTPGKGYIIMGATNKSMYPTIDEVVFTGKINNGEITPSIFLTPNADPEGDFNLIGNPYPSAVDADLFINTNLSKISGTLYFWTHKDDLGGGLNLGPDAYNYSQDDYAVYNLTGGTATVATTGTASVSNSAVPLGYIASCQGFFVEAEVDNTTVTFNNAMRVGLPSTANSQFYKTRSGKSKIESKDRLWLNLENSMGMFSQQLVGYFDNTTPGYDKGYDGLVSDGGNYVNFYSFIDDETYKIQGRSTFNENDQLRLGYFSAVAGNFDINIDSKEGVFTNSDISVYLEDKRLNIVHNLKQSPYSFTTESGTFNDRFVLRYNNKTLKNANFETLENQVLVSNKNKQVKVNSLSEMIDKVSVYDLLGREIYKKDKVNNNELSILNLASSQQTLLVRVALQNGQSVTKKIVY